MILNEKEKERIIQSLSWMVEDNKHHYDRDKDNPTGESDYSSELREAMSLLESVKKVETIEEAGSHVKVMLVNCRAFKCKFNNQSICALPKISLESRDPLFVGKLDCVEAEEAEEPKKEVK